MDKLKSDAREFFREHSGMCSDVELLLKFTNIQIDELSREGLIEMTAQPEVWAWKGD